MNILQMHEQFNILRDLYKAPYYDKDEIDVFLNSAISAFVVSSIPDPKKRNANVESQKTFDQISTIITTQKVIAFITANVTDMVELASCYFVKNQDFEFYYSSTCVINGKQASITTIDYNQITGLIDDAFNQPSNNEVKIVFFENRIYIISENVPDKFLLHYVKKPNIVSLDNSIDCNLPDSTHDKICHMAVQLSCGGSNLTELYKIQENETTKR